MPRCRVQLLALTAVLCSAPAALPAQAGLPATDSALARAEAPTWLAALAAACQSLDVDSTWHRVAIPESNEFLTLPGRLIARGTIFADGLYDVLPVVPARPYELLHYDPLTTRLMLNQATTAIRCPDPPPLALRSVWVLGFESQHRRDPLIRGVWHVVALWESQRQSFYGMSRDLWGARAFVTAMRLHVGAPDSAFKR